MKRLPVLFYLLFPLAVLHGQIHDLIVPRLSAPWLLFTTSDLLQAPKNAKLDWQSLRGKVVVVEFLCTWSSACVEEIPPLNSLADSLDASNVQFIAVDEDNPGFLQAYLEKHPIRGWVVPDPSRSNGKNWGVGPLPTIFIIDTKGNVVLMTLRPEHLLRESLLKLANGEQVALESDADAKADAETWEIIRTAQQAQALYDSSVPPVFSISITPGEANQGSGIAGDGHNSFAFINMPPDQLLIHALGIQPGQVKINGVLPKGGYNLMLHAPSLGSRQLKLIVDSAVEFVCGVRIERHTTVQDVYILKATDKAKLLPRRMNIIDFGQYRYSFGSNQLQLRRASVDDLADGLEEVLNKPVLNESGLSVDVTAIVQFVATDFEPFRGALEASTGFTLMPARRPIETITITPEAEAQKASSTQ